MPTPNTSPETRRRTGQPKGVRQKLEENDEPKKINHKEYLYDAKQKGWRGPIVGQTDTLRVTRIIKQQTRDLKNQTKDDVLHHRLKLQVTSPDLDEESDTASRILDISDAPGHDIPRPFTASFQEAKYATWNAPQRVEHRSNPQGMAWEKTLTKREKVGSSYHSTGSQLERMEAEMLSKEREIDILRAELFKSQKENYKLVQQLQSCSGKNYDELARENRALKSQVERLTKDNVKLQGQIRREGNSLLKRREYEQTVYALSETRSRSRSKSPSNVSRTSFKLDVRILPSVTMNRKNRKQDSDQNSGNISKRSSITYV